MHVQYSIQFSHLPDDLAVPSVSPAVELAAPSDNDGVPPSAALCALVAVALVAELMEPSGLAAAVRRLGVDAELTPAGFCWPK